MEQKAIYFRVGAVLLGGLALLAAVVIWVGSDLFRQAGRPFETYFAESVQGLDVGSAVRFRGVPIGRVTGVSMAASEYGRNDARMVLSDSAFQYVVVRFEVFTDRIGTNEFGAMGRMVEGGLRMRMASQGITGVLYLEADFVDASRFVPLRVPWEPRYPYIPAVPSTLTQFQSAAERMMARLEAADLPGLVMNANTLIGELAESARGGEAYRVLVEAADLLAELRTRAVELGPEVAAAVQETRATVQATRELLEGRDMRTITAGAASASARLPQTAAAIEQAARRLDATMADANRDLGPMLRDLRVTAENLKAITEQMRQFPSQVLFGSPPPREQPEGARQ